jgi:hypothetical protein
MNMNIHNMNKNMNMNKNLNLNMSMNLNIFEKKNCYPMSDCPLFGWSDIGIY